MINEILSLFDRYSRQARVLPGLWAAAPAIIAGVVLVPKEPLAALLPILLSCGFTILLANFTRSVGKNLEDRLVRKWDGMPTTHLLRHREAGNSTVFQRRRKALERLYGDRLPTKRQELANPASADEVYVAATRYLIRVLDTQRSAFPLVPKQNADYGQARNTLALRPYAFVVLLLGAGIDYYSWKSHGLSATWLVVVTLQAGLLAYWLFFVRESWVRQAGDTYAVRLFEALDQLSAGNQPPGHSDEEDADQLTQ
ncbi:hypothetical protein ACQP2P_38665 [Dactylosporangium sp. CA-139114]|uniref:hypothetical protein n=1 Tax=Dactylosporangium sp. CA-139114 TaxID=3239931 RepID=UPI003D9720CA